jgi:hypothetical protein
MASLVLLIGCGYHFEGGESASSMTSISIPYIKGDGEGLMNSELAKALSASGKFDYVQNGGELILEAAIVADGDDRIGYRYDRKPTSGKRRKNIVGTENRRGMSVQITLIDAYTHEVLLGPQIVRGTADYDYVDSNSIRDLTFTTTRGVPQKVLDFSLGQLDSVEGAHDDTNAVVYRIIAQKIVDGLIVQNATERASRPRS